MTSVFTPAASDSPAALREADAFGGTILTAASARNDQASQVGKTTHEDGSRADRHGSVESQNERETIVNIPEFLKDFANNLDRVTPGDYEEQMNMAGSGSERNALRAEQVLKYSSLAGLVGTTLVDGFDGTPESRFVDEFGQMKPNEYRALEQAGFDVPDEYLDDSVTKSGDPQDGTGLYAL